MDFSRALPRVVLSLLTLSTAPALAGAVYDSQWALENTGQHVCNFRGQRCTDGVAGHDIKYKLVKRFTDCSKVVVAVLDTGVDQRHPDLADNLLPGKNFVGGVQSDDPQDDNLHGTHVSGIIAGEGSESSGVVGVCHRARLLPVKVGGAEITSLPPAKQGVADVKAATARMNQRAQEQFLEAVRKVPPPREAGALSTPIIFSR